MLGGEVNVAPSEASFHLHLQGKSATLGEKNSIDIFLQIPLIAAIEHIPPRAASLRSSSIAYGTY